jgi:hypothetical protein
MFDPTDLDRPLNLLSQDIESHKLDHFFAYTTLLSISEVSSGQQLADPVSYEDGEYNNDMIKLYPNELRVMHLISSTNDESNSLDLLKIVAEHLDQREEVENLQESEAQEVLESIILPLFELLPSTPIADSMEAYQIPIMGELQVAVDSLVNVKTPGVYFVTVHLVSQVEATLANSAFFLDYDPQSNPKFIKFKEGYQELTEANLDSEDLSQALLITVMRYDSVGNTLQTESGETVGVVPVYFGLLPLKMSDVVTVQGAFQIPLVEQGMNVFLYDLIKVGNLWGLVEKIKGTDEDTGVEASEASLILRVRSQLFEGWRQDEVEFSKVSKMFMPDNGAEISDELHKELVKDGKVMAGLGKVDAKPAELREYLMAYFEEMDQDHKERGGK